LIFIFFVPNPPHHRHHEQDRLVEREVYARQGHELMG
jgi:hypothetical protein